MKNRNWILILLVLGVVVASLLLSGCYTATFVDDESDDTPYLHVYTYPYSYSYGHMWGVYGWPGWYPYYYGYPRYYYYPPTVIKPPHRYEGRRDFGVSRRPSPQLPHPLSGQADDCNCPPKTMQQERKQGSR